MPKDLNLKSVLVLGSGPIVIGQAAEFDYSGTQACRALKEEGVRTILVNSNPATIQTDLDTADRVYLEPLTSETVKEIILREKPDGILATMSGQTGLNLAVTLREFLTAHGVKVMGTSIETIELAEDREKFRNLMLSIGEPVPQSRRVKRLEDLEDAIQKIGMPVLLRPDFRMGGEGTVFIETADQLKIEGPRCFDLSGSHQVLVEKSVLGKAEIEYEVIRDGHDNCITICSMENLDPVGVHTGESIVVAPVQTLSDDDHQKLRSAAIRIVRKLGVQGACNVQFALDQTSGEYWVIEVNPRASRSSALASKATGYPIARIATKIALGYRLTEIENRITGKSAAFEPALDYVVLKVPRWPFDKFGLKELLGTSMKSTGETMSIGKNFEEAVIKAVRSLELKGSDVLENPAFEATEKRLFHLIDMLKTKTVEEVRDSTSINPWFLHKLKNLSATRTGLVDFAVLVDKKPVFNIVDTCAGEFEARTPYYYSTMFAGENECRKSTKRKVVILGSGPIRIGQGIEFDYSTVKAIQALREKGIQTVVINNNPETVSTDFDVSDKLYFEPLTTKDVLGVIENEAPIEGVLVQFGGQTALNLARSLDALGVPILGTSVSEIERAGDRRLFKELMARLRIPTVNSEVARSKEDALEAASKLRYPLLIRPSHVLGGRAMFVVRNLGQLEHRIEESLRISEGSPVILDEFLDEATEIDVDALGDGKRAFVAGVMEQIEEAGVHSGDSACVLPAQTLSPRTLALIQDYSERIVVALGVKGFCNIQMAVKGEDVIVIEVNPRASRTIPYVSKAIGLPLAKISALIQLGLSDLSGIKVPVMPFAAVKAPVFPFRRFPNLDPLLNAEMKSTGETMGFGKTFSEAYLKALKAAGFDYSGFVFFGQLGKYARAITSAFEKAGVKTAKTLEEASFVISLTDDDSALRKRAIFLGKSTSTSVFAALKLASCLSENPIQSILSLNEAHESLKTVLERKD